MKKTSVMRQEDFDHLLDWLSPEREEAGQKYEEIRAGLIRYFRFRGCSDSPALADETINRVAARVLTFKAENNPRAINLFYGFASNIYLEYIRQRAKREVQLDPEMSFADNHLPVLVNTGEDTVYLCLEQCLAKLPTGESAMVVRYYSKEGIEKAELRKKMAESLSLKVGTLHTRVHRIRDVLKKCVEKCAAEK